MKKVNLAIVDDEVLLVELLKNYFDDKNNFNVVLTSNNGEEFLNKLKFSKKIPEVVLLDLRMDKMDGAETTRCLRNLYPEMKVIVISSYYKKSFIGYMLKSGVNVFIPKNIPPHKLEIIIKKVIEFDHYFLDEQMTILKSQISPKVPQPKFDTEETQTEREIEVLTLICKQLTAQEIADKLFITKRTVEGHRTNLLMKTGVKNTAGLVIYAVSHKIFDTNEFS